MKKQAIYSISGIILFLAGIINWINNQKYEPSIFVGAFIISTISIVEWLGDK